MSENDEGAKKGPRAASTRRVFLKQSATAAAVVGLGLELPGLERVALAKARPVKIVKGPFVQLLGPGDARLRFETRDSSPMNVTVTREGATTATPYVTEARTREVHFKWPDRKVKKRPPPFPDLPGEHTIHDVALSALDPGVRYHWSVDRTHGEVVEGSFMAPPAKGGSFRLGWLADTRRLLDRETATRLLSLSPDLVIHGGDIQYHSDKRDTWNGFFQAMNGLFQRAPAHFCVGNHENDGYKAFEYHELFMKLFEEQGAPGGRTTYYTFRYGGAQFVVIDTEDRDLWKGKGAQLDWLRATLTAAKGAVEVDRIIAVFHRPIFTFSKRQPEGQTRDILHGLFTEHEVPLVLTGHNHCYERFEVDGVTYITDGGGGASLYKLDHNRRRIERKEPHLIPLRKVGSETHGVTIVDFSPSKLVVERQQPDGTVTDHFEVLK